MLQLISRHKSSEILTAMTGEVRSIESCNQNQNFLIFFFEVSSPPDSINGDFLNQSSQDKCASLDWDKELPGSVLVLLCPAPIACSEPATLTASLLEPTLMLEHFFFGSLQLLSEE